MPAIGSSATQLSDLAPICTRLPSASVDQLIGATKILSRSGGRLTPRMLAMALAYDDEHLASVVEFLSSLGLTEVSENEIALSAVGKQIASSGIASRRRLFSELIVHFPIVRRIVDILADQPNCSLPRTKLLEDLGAQACASDADLIFDHVATWGRYAGLFSYDASSGLVSLSRRR